MPKEPSEQRSGSMLHDCFRAGQGESRLQGSNGRQSRPGAKTAVTGVIAVVWLLRMYGFYVRMASQESLKRYHMSGAIPDAAHAYTQPSNTTPATFANGPLVLQAWLCLENNEQYLL